MYIVGTQLHVQVESESYDLRPYCKFIALLLVESFELFDSTGIKTIKTGSEGLEPSFVGIIASVSAKCRRLQLIQSPWQRSQQYYLANLAETRFRGLWYFDEVTFPRPNLANPYNIEPRFYAHPVDAPVWDSALKR